MILKGNLLQLLPTPQFLFFHSATFLYGTSRVHTSDTSQGCVLHHGPQRQRVTPPPDPSLLSRMNSQVRLKDFAKSLEQAVKTIFPGQDQTRYRGVSVLLITWEDDEDPKLPLSVEVAELREVFDSFYRFQTDIFLIPSINSQKSLNARILDFIDSRRSAGNDSLKIVYYGGHAKLSSHRHLLWMRYVIVASSLELLNADFILQ